MTYTYTLHTDTYIDERGKSHTTYGITACETKSRIIVNRINDIFCNYIQAAEFVNKLNHLSLSPIHLMDAVEDKLNTP